MVKMVHIKTPESIATTRVLRKFEITTNQITMTNLHNSYKEIWKDINGFEGCYQVSNLGNVRSLPREILYKSGGIHKSHNPLLLKKIIKSTGYCVFSPSRNNVRKQTHIHRVVAETFIPNPLNLPQVNHINGIKTDNRVENLEWCTQRENNIHSYRSGLKTISIKQKLFIGNYSRMYKRRKVLQFDAATGNYIAEYESIDVASQRTGAHKSAISACCRGVVKRAKNYKFKYA